MIYYKIIGKNYGNYPYHLGLNTLEQNNEIFDDSSNCCPSGLYYTTDQYIWDYLDYGDRLCILEIPDDAKQIQIDDKYKSDKIIIKEIKSVCLETILELKLPMMSIDQASRYGYIEILNWWLEQYKTHHIKLKYTYSAIDGASLNGHVDVLDWWFEQYKTHQLELKYTENTIDVASENGHIDVLDWWLEQHKIHQLEFKYTCYAFDFASENGHMKILDWWLEQYKTDQLEFKYIEGAIDFV